MAITQGFTLHDKVSPKEPEQSRDHSQLPYHPPFPFRFSSSSRGGVINSSLDQDSQVGSVHNWPHLGCGYSAEFDEGLDLERMKRNFTDDAKMLCLNA